MRFIWFLDFWSWSRETYRAEMLLRHPLEGIAANWDEWYGEEATEVERAEIDLVGQNPAIQEEFLRWLEQVWIKDAVTNGNQLVFHFVCGELAKISPFDRWAALAKMRDGGSSGGISAIVLSGQSKGESDDVMTVRAALLPLGGAARSRSIVADGFDAEENDLNVARESTLRLLRGRSGWRMLAAWLVHGRRPYPSWLKPFLAAGWLGIGAGMAWLYFGPDPGAALRVIAITLLVTWAILVLLGVTTAFAVVLQARTAARKSAALLSGDQVRLRIDRRLQLKGGSAGLPFALEILRAIARAYPATFNASWLLRQFSAGLQSPETSWAATGIVAASGQVHPVELTPKIRSCFKHGRLAGILVPHQREASNGSIRRVADGTQNAARENPPVSGEENGPEATQEKLRVHRCRHLGDALLAVARVPSAKQRWLGVFALIVSGVMLCAVSDLRCIVFPPPAPVVVPPSSPSPYFLWVSLDTAHPDFFEVVLDSRVWANRRAEVSFQESLPPSVRAEIRLVRLGETAASDLQEGIVLIERRPTFLSRKFKPGEVVGRYSLHYLNRLRHD